jgi:hypothetical protein
LHSTGPVYFAYPGSIVECPDEAGYDLLKEEGDIIKRLEDEPEIEKPKRKPRKPKNIVPSNRSIKEYEVK